MDELAELAKTAGADVVGEGTQKLDSQTPPPTSAAARRPSSPVTAKSCPWTPSSLTTVESRTGARNLEEAFGTRCLIAPD